MARPDQIADHRSLVGALSWLAGQFRPDLQCGVSMAQQVQKSPSVRDLKFTNQLAKRALEHQEGVRLRPVPLEDAVVLCDHDAGWSNAPQNHEDPYYQLYPEDEDSGKIDVGPFAHRPKKSKKGATSIASQLGVVFLLAHKDVLHGAAARTSLLAESMPKHLRSRDDGLRPWTGRWSVSLLAIGDLETLMAGRLVRPQQARAKVHLLTDCRSLFDHLNREGIPRAPAERRLAIDLAAIREVLPGISGLSWVPTEEQPRRAHEWQALLKPLRLPFTLSKKENLYSV